MCGGSRPSVYDDTSSELQRVGVIEPRGLHSQNSFRGRGALSRWWQPTSINHSQHPLLTGFQQLSFSLHLWVICTRRVQFVSHRPSGWWVWWWRSETGPIRVSMKRKSVQTPSWNAFEGPSSRWLPVGSAPQGPTQTAPTAMLKPSVYQHPVLSVSETTRITEPCVT